MFVVLEFNMKQDKSNSISFGPVKYIPQEHLLRAEVKRGKNSIRCAITEDVFTDLYKCSAEERALTQSFQQHLPELSHALELKMGQKQWKPNEEILLNAKDVRKFIH